MHPLLHLWGAVYLSTYYACMTTGLILATFVVRRQALRTALRPRDVFDAALAVVPAGVLGARGIVVLADLPFFVSHPSSLLTFHGGWAVHGGLAGACLGVVAVSWWKGIDVRRMLDVFAPAFAFGQMIARVGCLGAGCCHGRPADWPLGAEVPWSVTYLAPGGVPEPLLGVPLHPAPLYESVLMAFAFALTARPGFGRAYPGATFAAFLTVWGGGRFVLEWFRGDLHRGFYGPLSTGQITSLTMVAIALAVHLVGRSRSIPS